MVLKVATEAGIYNGAFLHVGQTYDDGQPEAVGGDPGLHEGDGKQETADNPQGGADPEQPEA